MSQTKYTRSRVQASVWVTEPIPIDDVRSDVDSVGEKIRAGQAFLRVVEYPWGVEFDICGVEGAK